MGEERVVSARAGEHQEHRHLEGKTALVTGATSGIGEVTARELARRGAHVLLAGRTLEKSQAAQARLLAEVSEATITPLGADLRSLEEVRNLAQAALAAEAHLDLLVNNAGCLCSTLNLTQDGFEETWEVNYLAPFLLTRLLLPRLRASGPSRIINVSSEAHREARGDWSELFSSRRFGSFRAYAESKLALLLFTFELGRLVPAQEVTVNAVHPGVVQTALGAQGSGLGPWFFRRALGAVGLSPEEGAQTTVFAATSDLMAGITGQYLAHSRLTPTADLAQDPVLAHRLWVLTEKLVGLPPLERPDEEPGGTPESVEGVAFPFAGASRNPVLARHNP